MTLKRRPKTTTAQKMEFLRAYEESVRKATPEQLPLLIKQIRQQMLSAGYYWPSTSGPDIDINIKNRLRILGWIPRY